MDTNETTQNTAPADPPAAPPPADGAPAPEVLVAELAHGEATARVDGVQEAAWPSWAPPLPTPEALGPEVPEWRPQTPEEFEAALDAPAPTPSSYRLPPMTDGEVAPQEKAALQGVQSLLWHGDFPVNAGNRLMQTISEEARRVGEDMDDAAFELQCKQTDAALDRIYGPERHAELRGKLSAFLTDLGKKTPGGLDDLYDAYGHVLATPRVMAELLQHVDRLDVRKRK